MERLNVDFREIKFADDGARTFSGYGAVFGNQDDNGDVIAAGAFKATLREAKRDGRWPPMLLQHGGFLGGVELTPIGVWTELGEDETGLKVEGTLAETPRGEEVYRLLKMAPRPALNGLSIGFRPKEFVLGTKPDEPRRTLKRVELFEISIVTLPANPKARIEAVKAIEEIDSLSDAEEILREAGFSRNYATLLVSRVKSLAQSESAGPAPQSESVGPQEVASALKRNLAILNPQTGA